MEIFFIRHGEANLEEENYSRRLTPKGRLQAKSQAIIWKNAGVSFETIISSPYQRTQETAQIIGEVLDCPVETSNDWCEYDRPKGDKVSYHITKEGYKIPKVKSIAQSQESGESYWCLHSRSMAALSNIMNKKHQKILVVSHGGILNAAFRTIMGANPPVNGNGLYFQLGHAGYLHTEFESEEHMWIVKTYESGELF